MKWNSTRNPELSITLKDALFKGLAPDGGLFMPATETHHVVPETVSLVESAIHFLAPFVSPDITKDALSEILQDALNFEIPVVNIAEGMYVLELFHGPTLAFKDVGGRIMAGLLSAVYDNPEPLTILAATSGDTGSAVASAFLGKPGFRVVLLFPSGQVSEIQERQLTTFGQNVTTLEVHGTFDDCQKLVKQAFSDVDLRNAVNLTSANSINIGRWLPQAVYYHHAWNQLQELHPKSKPIAAVPSGNLGNVAAGLMAMRHGAAFSKMIVACNANKSFYDFMQSASFEPRASLRTVSNAMDVGNPSNFERIAALYKNDLQEMKNDIYATTHSDAETCEAIKSVYEKTGYMMDPHTAVGYLGWKQYQAESGSTEPVVILSTAHPAKFGDVIQKAINVEPEMPKRLAACFNVEKQSIELNPDYDAFKAFLQGMK